MDYLTLCKRLRQEARIAGTGPSATGNQTGEAARIVSWINNAWRDIQRWHNSWLWMHRDFTFATVPGQTDYAPAELGISDPVRDWDRYSFSIYGTALGVQDETEVCYIPWAVWKRQYDFGTQVASRPIHWTIKPDRSIAIGPKPEKDYTLRGEYWKGASELASDGDTPDMPEEYHMLIVWWALTKYAASEAAPEVYAWGESERIRMLGELELTQLPDFLLSGPLA